MSLPVTETSPDAYRGLDLWPSEAILSAIVTAQTQAVSAVAAAVPVLAAAGEAIAARLRAGGRMVYVGAGSSGLMAQIDALELPGTYGIPAEATPVLLAGGTAALLTMPAEAEDDSDAAVQAVVETRLCARDTLIALSASGSTPFPLAALREAKWRGALTVGIANNPETPLLTEAEFPVLLATPPEVVAGSTRMNAGTAQKCALNMLSTLVAIRLGHAFDGLMINLQADNLKLRGRAVRIVAQACALPEPEAAALLGRAEGNIKAAVVLHHAPDLSLADALTCLAAHKGDVRAVLAALPHS